MILLPSVTYEGAGAGVGRLDRPPGSYVCPWWPWESSGTQPHQASSASLASSWPLALGAGLHFLLQPQATSPSPGVVCLLICPRGGSAPFTPIPTPCSGDSLLEKGLEEQQPDQERPPLEEERGITTAPEPSLLVSVPCLECCGPRGGAQLLTPDRSVLTLTIPCPRGSP